MNEADWALSTATVFLPCVHVGVCGPWVTSWISNNCLPRWTVSVFLSFSCFFLFKCPFLLRLPAIHPHFHFPQLFLLSGAGVLGDRHASGEETDPSLQLLWGRRVDGVLRAGQRFGGAAVPDSSPGWTHTAVSACRVLQSGKEPTHLWVRLPFLQNHKEHKSQTSLGLHSNN